MPKPKKKLTGDIILSHSSWHYNKIPIGIKLDDFFSSVGRVDPKLIWAGGHIEQINNFLSIVTTASDNKECKIITIDTSTTLTKVYHKERPLVYWIIKVINNEPIIKIHIDYKTETITLPKDFYN